MYIKRKLEGTITKYLETPEILALVGPRQCGKTTMLRHIFESLKPRAVFLTFEDKELLDLFEGNIKQFIKQFGSYRYVFIDEFQYAKAGGKHLKFWYDTKPTKIIISGSSVIDLSVKAVKHLVGRVFIFNLYPLDFEEFLGAYGAGPRQIYEKNKITPDFKWQARGAGGATAADSVLMGRLYEQYCLYGGYPRVATARGREEKRQVIKDIYNTFFLREVRDALGLVDDFRLGKLLKLLAGQIANLIQYRELSVGSEFSEYEVKKYLNFFTKTFICVFPKPFFTNPRTQLVKNPKVFFLDNGLRNYLVDDFRPLAERADAGAVLENSVAGQLLKQGLDFCFWRTKKQFEVDFVVNLPAGRKVALEVKKRLKGLGASMREFRKLYPAIPLRCVYFDADSPSLGQDNIPIWLL